MRKLFGIIKQLGILMIALTFILPVTVYAQENEGTIHVTELAISDKKPVEGVKLTLYQVAVTDGAAGQKYVFTKAFSDSGIQLEDLQSANGYKTVLKKLNKFVQKYEPDGLEEKTTDNEGRVSFTDLPDGVYLVRQTNLMEDFKELGYSVATEPYLIVLPWMDETGVLFRTVQCQPKCTVQRYPLDYLEGTDITVYKVWKDSNDVKGIRPKKIQVGLYGDGELEEQVALSAKNNWTYHWEGLDSDVSWSVKEMQVPAGYESAVSKEKTVFTITNTMVENSDNPPGNSDNPPGGSDNPPGDSNNPPGNSSNPPGNSNNPPTNSGSSTTNVKTGDSTNIAIYVILLCAALLGGTTAILSKKRS